MAYKPSAPFGVETTIIFEFFELETIGIVEAQKSLIIFLGINAISSIINVLHEEPRLADEDVEQARIEEPFANSIAPLLYVKMPGFI